MPVPKYTPLTDITGLCERIYERDGFVKWSEVASALGLSRQAVQARLSKAVAAGDLPEDVYDRWRSVSSRLTQSKRNRELKKENERCRISVVLSPENKQWVLEECVTRRCSSADIINGLINREREQK